MCTHNSHQVRGRSRSLASSIPCLRGSPMSAGREERPRQSTGRPGSRLSEPPRARNAIVALTIAFLVLGATSCGGLGRPQPPEGVRSFEVPERPKHVEKNVSYPQTPPVAGDHSLIWQNCGFYEAPIEDELAVHSMEHGAVWITYQPDLSREELGGLRELAGGQTYVLASPFPDLPVPVVASAWGKQLRLDQADDPRLEQFVNAFREGPQAPESGPCTEGKDHP